MSHFVLAKRKTKWPTSRHAFEESKYVGRSLKTNVHVAGAVAGGTFLAEHPMHLSTRCEVVHCFMSRRTCNKCRFDRCAFRFLLVRLCDSYLVCAGRITRRNKHGCNTPGLSADADLLSCTFTCWRVNSFQKLPTCPVCELHSELTTFETVGFECTRTAMGFSFGHRIGEKIGKMLSRSVRPSF